MIYHNLSGKEIEKMSFESYFQSGSMIGGEVIVNPVLQLKTRDITDIRVGYETYTTWAYEKPVFDKGEEISECLKRHNATMEDVKKVVVTCFDSTGDENIIREFIWTAETGWTEETEEI